MRRQKERREARLARLDKSLDEDPQRGMDNVLVLRGHEQILKGLDVRVLPMRVGDLFQAAAI
jgi:FKBP-type peptidyl-prolyl cis-trans isomerase 2